MLLAAAVNASVWMSERKKASFCPWRSLQPLKMTAEPALSKALLPLMEGGISMIMVLRSSGKAATSLTHRPEILSIAKKAILKTRAAMYMVTCFVVRSWIHEVSVC